MSGYVLDKVEFRAKKNYFGKRGTLHNKRINPPR